MFVKFDETKPNKVALDTLMKAFIKELKKAAEVEDDSTDKFRTLGFCLCYLRPRLHTKHQYVLDSSQFIDDVMYEWDLTFSELKLSHIVAYLETYEWTFKVDNEWDATISAYEIVRKS